MVGKSDLASHLPEPGPNRVSWFSTKPILPAGTPGWMGRGFRSCGLMAFSWASRWRQEITRWSSVTSPPRSGWAFSYHWPFLFWGSERRDMSGDSKTFSILAKGIMGLYLAFLLCWAFRFQEIGRAS